MKLSKISCPGLRLGSPCDSQRLYVYVTAKLINSVIINDNNLLLIINTSFSKFYKYYVLIKFIINN